MRRTPHPHFGFTLIELIIVIGVLAIVAAVAFPRAPDTGIGVRPQAEQLASDIRYAQLLSMSNHQRYCVTFSGNAYSLTSASSNCTVAVAHPAGLTQPITLQNATQTVTGLTSNYLVFDGQGAPFVSVGASPTPLSNAGATITVAAGGTSATLTIAAMTGLVTGP